MRREKPIFTENEAVGEVHFAYTHENVICKITFFFNELSITSVLAQIVPPLSSRIHYAVQYKFRYNTLLSWFTLHIHLHTGQKSLSPAQTKAVYISHNCICKVYNKIIVSQLKSKQVNENNCYLHLSTVTLLPFFQVAISTFPPSIHSLGIWHVGKAHPSTWVQILLQLSPVALVEHSGERVPEYEHGAEKHHDRSRQWFRAPKVITYQS